MPKYSLKLACRDGSATDIINSATKETVEEYCLRRIKEFLNPKAEQEILQVYYLMDDKIKDCIAEDFDLYTVSYAKVFDYNNLLAVRSYVLCNDKLEVNALKVMFGEYIL